MKNIIHFSSYDVGGAGSAALRFHKNLESRGFNSLFFVEHKQTDEKSVIQIAGKNRFIYELLGKLDHRLKPFDAKYYFYDKHRNSVLNVDDVQRHLPKTVDVIVLHWISGFVDLTVIQQLQHKYNCKVYWYLMDMAPMTGGCHYAWDCDGYQKQCLHCPAVRGLYKILPMMTFLQKRKITDKMDIELLAGSSWLKDQLYNSTLFRRKKIHDLMLGIDDNIFKPLSDSEKTIQKTALGFEPDKKIVFFGASDLIEDRKGFAYLLKALKILSDADEFNNNEVILLTAGRNVTDEVYRGITIEHRYVGHVTTDTELASLYQIADIFVSPSIEDSGPMMINEAILCGTPVVAFNMGVAFDLVKTDITGYLSSLADVDDLARGIIKVLGQDKNKYSMMRNSCRKLGLELTSVNSQMQKFIQLLDGDQ